MSWPGWSRTAYAVVVAVLVVSAQLQVWVGTSDVSGGRLVESLLVAGATVPLVALRRWPLPVLLAVVAGGAGLWLVDSPLGQPWFALLLALYGLGNRAGVGSATLGGVVVAGFVLWADLPRLRAGADISDVVPAWFIMAAVFGFGRWMHHRAEEQAALRTRTETLEREHAATVAALVAEEQARIARELHDLVAHALAVIVLQAQAAGRVVDHDPAQAREALGSIEDVGREGLVELRRLLDVLDPAAAEDDSSRPGLDQLPELASRVRGAGLPVEVVVSGSPRSLPAGLDLSAYRIVQEALTNTLKHAGPARSTVAVRYLPDAVEVEVVDDGGGGGRPSVGQRVGRGLIGMRERTALYGGTLVAGRDSAGEGFRVQARFPLEATP